MRGRKTVYLAILNQGWIRSELAFLISKWSRTNNYNIRLSLPADKPIANNRNKIVKKFLDSEADYLMMLDNDIIPPKKVFSLVDYDKDVIGGLCFAFKDKTGTIPLMLEYHPERLKEQKLPYLVLDPEEKSGLQQVDAIGTGHIIIARRVLEHPEMKAPFTNFYDEDGIRTEGLDLSFCRRAREQDFEVWVHADYKCSHWAPFDLKKVYEQRVGKIEENDIIY